MNSESNNAKLVAFYDQKNLEQDWHPIRLRPNAISTNAYDDVARLGDGLSGSMLEIGCGIGNFTVSIGSQFDKVIGTDISPVAVRRARYEQAASLPELNPKISYLESNADESLQFSDDEFDVVIMVAVLEHVIDVFYVMDEIYRVLKPGGSVILTVPNAAYVKHVRDLLLGKVPLTGVHTRDMNEWRTLGWDGAHFHNFTKSTVDQLLNNVGFIPVRWTGDGRYAKFRRFMPNLVGSITVRAEKV